MGDLKTHGLEMKTRDRDEEYGENMGLGSEIDLEMKNIGMTWSGEEK